MTEYNKLVRDRIPEIIEAAGERCEIRRLTNEEFLQQLRIKLREEFEEYEISGEVEELADMVEVILALASFSAVAPDEFERLRKRKRDERGGFDERILLLWTSSA